MTESTFRQGGERTGFFGSLREAFSASVAEERGGDLARSQRIARHNEILKGRTDAPANEVDLYAKEEARKEADVLSIVESRRLLARSLAETRSPNRLRNARTLGSSIREYAYASDVHEIVLARKISESNEGLSGSDLYAASTMMVIEDRTATESLVVNEFVDMNKKHGRFMNWFSGTSPIAKGLMAGLSAFALRGGLGVAVNVGVAHRLGSRFMASNREEVETRHDINTQKLESDLDDFKELDLTPSGMASMSQQAHRRDFEGDTESRKRETRPIMYGTIGGAATRGVVGLIN